MGLVANQISRLAVYCYATMFRRPVVQKEGQKFLKEENPDILCLQEIKSSDDSIPTEANINGYHAYWKASDKPGYAGVGLYSKVKPISVKFGLDMPEHDTEGRIVQAEYESFYFVGAYVPNSGRGLLRLNYRQKWNSDFLKYIKSLDAKKPVIYCGDLNVSHTEIDLANPKANVRNAGFTNEEREDFSVLLDAGFIDSFRSLYPGAIGAYSYWAYFKNAREKNIGWRLDYFILSNRLEKNLCDSAILSKVMGSDHCPIVLYMKL